MANSSQSTDMLAKSRTGGKREASYGGWSSPIDAALVASGALSLSFPSYGDDGQSLYFVEGRPAEGGRQVLVRRPAGASSAVLEDVTPAGVNVRSLVHEYGGLAYAVAGDYVFYVNYSDQRIYMLSAKKDQDQAAKTPVPLSPVSPVSAEADYRFADLAVDQVGKRIFAVMENHGPVKSGQAHEPENSLIALSYADAEAALEQGRADLVKPAALITMASGADFYAYPRLSPDGKKFAYMRWNHPNLPWDDSELVLCDLSVEGIPKMQRVVAGGPDCSVFQPEWGPDGKLFFVSDQTGFWNLYCVVDFDSLEANNIVAKIFRQCEFGAPLWGLGKRTFVVAADNLIICAVNRRGLWHLARLELDFAGEHRLIEIPGPYTEVSDLSLGAGRVAMLAGSPEVPASVVEFDWTDRSYRSVRCSAAMVPDTGYLSRPEVIEFPTEGGKTAFAFYYPPTNQDFDGPPGELPPLLVKCHGGPTGSTSSVLALGRQRWTSRGFAVVDVNYGGSTGYGRQYRKRLNGNWGVVDVDDCANAVKYLAEQGRVDKNRVFISGGSAGGYTVLCALTFKDVFAAGASHYGIGDLEALVRDTHKFEARYGDNLVGPYPEMKSVYAARSPINHIDKLKCPVIFFQGLEDKVVPPNQAEAMVEALDAKKIPVAYIAYEGEQHGFRQAANIIRTMEAELYFFRRIFKIDSEEKLEAVAIKNLSD